MRCGGGICHYIPDLHARVGALAKAALLPAIPNLSSMQKVPWRCLVEQFDVTQGAVQLDLLGCNQHDI